MFSSIRSPRISPRFMGFLFFLGSLFLAYIVSQWVLEDRPFGVAERVAIFFGFGVILAVLGRWRFGVLIFLVWLTFEDLFRKYLGNDMSVYFIKDLLVAAVYGAFFFSVMKRRDRPFRPPFRAPLLAFVALGFVQMFNPRSTSIFYGLLGMQVYFYYVPLIFVGYALLFNQDDLDRFLSLNLKIASVVAAIGIIQASGPRTFLNPAVLAPQLQALGHLTRYVPGLAHVLQAPPSVFVSAGRYANYLQLMFTLALGTAAFQLSRRRSARWTYLTLAVMGVAIFLSGSKGALVYSLITLVSFAVALLWGVRGQPRISARLGKIIRRSVVALAAGFCLFVAFYPNLTSSWGTYYYDLLWPDSANSELGFRVGNYPLSEFEKALHYPHWVTGYGTGISSLGVEYVTGSLHEPDPPVGGVENGFGTIMIEMGVLGPIFWVLMGGAVVLAGWNVTKRLTSTPLYPVALSIVWFAFWILFPFSWGSMSAYQNFVVNAYLWLLIGVLFRLPFLTGETRTEPSAVLAVAARPAEPLQVGQTP
jgi:hypothetical protein